MGKFFKRFIAIVGVIALIGTTFVSCQKETTNKNGEVLQTIRLNEVVRSVFYSGLYVSISEGFFEEEGIKIDLSTGQGADKTMQQLLSGNVDIGFSGPEQVVYIYNQGREDYPVVFGQLTQKDGSFLVGREAEEDFEWASLKGKEVIGGRPGGIPEMALEYVLKQNGLTIGTNKEAGEVNVRTDIQFGVMAGAFAGGEGDFTTAFEPTGTQMEKDATGYIVASVGELAGDVPYTAYSATKEFIADNEDLIQRFTNALYKGQQWCKTASNEEIAKAMQPFFNDLSLDDLVSVVDRYKSIDAWCDNPLLTEESLNSLVEIMKEAGELDKEPVYNDIVTTDFANKAIENNK